MHKIKKYANRKLYDTTDKKYISLDHLAELIKAGEEVTVVLKKCGSITGVILRPDGQPLPGASVRTYKKAKIPEGDTMGLWGPEAISDRAGKYTITEIVGEDYTLLARAGGHGQNDQAIAHVGQPAAHPGRHQQQQRRHHVQ